MPSTRMLVSTGFAGAGKPIPSTLVFVKILVTDLQLFAIRAALVCDAFNFDQSFAVWPYRLWSGCRWVSWWVLQRLQGLCGRAGALRGGQLLRRSLLGHEKMRGLSQRFSDLLFTSSPDQAVAGSYV